MYHTGSPPVSFFVTICIFVVFFFIIPTMMLLINKSTQLNNIRPTEIERMGGISVKDRRTNGELRRLVGVEPVITFIRSGRPRWCGHVVRKGDEDWVKNCMEYRVEGRRPVGRPRKTWLESVDADMAELEIDKEDVHDRCKWRRNVNIMKGSPTLSENGLQTVNIYIYIYNKHCNKLHKFLTTSRIMSNQMQLTKSIIISHCFTLEFSMSYM